MGERVKTFERELSNSSCKSDIYQDLIIAFRKRDALKFEKLLSNSEVDPDHWYDEPDYGTLLDLCAMMGKCHDFIKLLLQNGADPNVMNRFRKKRPIHFICINNDTDSLKILLESSKVDVDLTDDFGRTALHYAAQHPETTAIKLLISHNANLDILNRKGKTALHAAIERKNKETSQALVDAGADLSITDPDDITLKDAILSAFPDINLPANGNKLSTKPLTPDKLFGILRDFRFNEFLKGIKENQHLIEKDDGSYTFLQYCCLNGHDELVTNLLNYGANPNSTTESVQQTPLMLASQRGNFTIVNILLNQPTIDFSPVNGETALHLVVDGGQSTAFLNSDHLQCLNLLLTKAPKSKLNINKKNVKGNTALHLAAKLQQDKMVGLLLKHGAFIGEENVRGEPASADISYDTFSEHLDSCISTNDALSREDNYEITINYGFLLQKYVKKDYLLEAPDFGYTDPSNKHWRPETKPLLDIAKNRELRPLLIHPVFNSFLHLKWHRIRKYFFINLVFYILFWLFLTIYILGVFSNQSIDDQKTSNVTSASEGKAANNFSSIWFLVMIFLTLLVLREVFQLCLTPKKYLTSLENWLEIGIIIITFVILFSGNISTSNRICHQISAVGIMMSWYELILLIGRLPQLSTYIEMLKTVSYNFLKFLAWYSILIIAFALSFYTLFKDSGDSNNEPADSSDGENFFEDPGNSIFKTVVMLTGEFDAGSIPFMKYPITSQVLFVFFIFLVAIVLFNLLNGLAVSDTQSIRSDAELVSVIARAKLICYLETTLANPSSLMEALLKCFDVSYKLRSEIMIASTLSLDNIARILPNKNGRCILTDDSKSSSRKAKKNICSIIRLETYMEKDIIKNAVHVLKKNFEQHKLQKIEQEEQEKKGQLQKEIEEIKHSIKKLTEIVLEDRKILERIVNRDVREDFKK